MPVSYSSVARNLFLLGSSGADAVVNFFKSVDKSPAIAFSEGQFNPTGGIKYDQDKYLISGQALGSDSFVWIDKRGYDPETSASATDWENRIYPTVYSSYMSLTDMELDSNSNVIAVGKVGGVGGDYGTCSCWIAKYSSAGVLQWQSTTNTGDLEYRSVTSDSNGNYYACGSTPESGEALAFVEKFDASGNPSWGKSAFMLGRDVVLEKISANSKGEVVAVGYLEDDSADKGYIVKIDTNTGEVLWDRTLERSIVGSAGTIPADVRCTACYIDSNDQIYVVGTVDGNNPVNNGVGEFLIKYTAEGNIVWQRENNTDQWTQLDGAPNMIPFDVWSDGETEQTVVLSVEDQGSFSLNDSDLFISKYTRNGDIVFRRKISKGGDNLGTAGLDGDSSYYYVVFRDQQISGIDPERYTFGKVSSSGNGLGTFNYNDGSGSGDDVDYIAISNPENKIGKMSDGSVSNSSSDLMTYPFGANKLVFDDLATHVSNKRRQLDSADSFEYSGSPAIRPADFQELNLLGENVSDRIWTDISGKGNNGVASLTEPFFGAGSVSFGGKSVNDYLEIASHPDFDQTQAQTLEYWILFTNLSGNTIPVGRGDDYIGITVVGTGGGYQLWVSQFGGQSLVSGPSTYVVENDIWYHIAFTKEADPGQSLSPEWKLFVNGDLKNIFYTSQEQTLSAPLQIGRDPDSTSSLEGFISNLRIVNGSQVYTENFTPPTTPLTAIPGTVLLTCQGTTIADASSNNFTVTANGNAAPTDDGPTHNAAGYWEFDGVDDYVSIADDPSLHAEEMSWEWWMWNDALQPSGATAFLIKRTGNADGYMIFTDSSGNLNSDFGTAVGLTNRWNTSYNVGSNLNQWIHCVLTRSNSNRRFYVNGEKYANTTNVGVYTTAASDLVIGADSSDVTRYNVDGRMGEVRIYPRALTPAQAFQNYNATKSKYINEAPDTAPKITTNPIVMNSNLLLNYDFGNRATYDRAENVVRHSEDFKVDELQTWGSTDTNWLDKSKLTSNYAMSPFGEMTATRVANDTGSDKFLNYRPKYSGNGSIDVSGQWTVSAFVKPLSNPCTIQLTQWDGFSESKGVFNLVSGTLSSSNATDANTIEEVGGGWYRISSTATNGNTNTAFQIKFFDGTDLLLYGAQMESGSTLGRYIKTSGSAITAPTTVKNLSSSSIPGTINLAPYNSGGWFEFDGSSNSGTRIAFDSSTIDLSGNFSIDMWFRQGDQSPDYYMLLGASGYGSAGENGIGHYLYGNAIVTWAQDTLGSNTTVNIWDSSSTTTLTSGVWYNLILTRQSGTAWRWYLNGSLVNSNTTQFLTVDFTSATTYVGDHYNSDYQFDGDIGEVRMYNKALNSTEVSQNFNATRSKYGV